MSAKPKPVTVGQLKKALNKFSDDTPIISASDDEGNNFGYVWYEPSRMWYNREFQETTGEKPEDMDGWEEVVCVN